MGKWRQIMCTGILSYLCMSVGLMFTWPSSTLGLFQSARSPLSRALSPPELAMFGSLSSAAALLSTPLAALLLDRLGRKYCTVLASLTHVVAWALIATCSRVELVLGAVFVSGVGGCAFLTSPLFVSEICEVSIRGAMTAACMVFYSLGMLLSYVCGGYLQYSTMSQVCLAVSALGVLMTPALKESPVYLLAKGRDAEAAKSIAFYRSAEPGSKEVLEEILTIKRALNPDNDDYVAEDQKKLKTISAEPAQKLSAIQFIKKSPSTRRGVALCLTLMTASMFQGLVAVQVYAEPLFQEAVPNMSPALCTVLFAVVMLLSSSAAAYLSDVAGRKPLMVYGSVGSGVSCVLLGSQIQYRWAPHAFTAACMYAFCVVYTVGAGTVPYVLAAEVFLPEIKSFMGMLVIEYAWLCNCVILFIFNPLVRWLGLGAVFYLFAAVCFATAVYCVCRQPETRGLSVDVIQTMYTKGRRRGDC